MIRLSKLFGIGLAGIAGASSPQAQAASSDVPSAEQAKMLDVLERGAMHVLKNGDHLPVTAFIMRPSGEIEIIDLGQGFAHQEDALNATLQRLIPMARSKEIKVSGIMFQPGDAGTEKPHVLIFDVEQVGHPRFFVTLTYARKGSDVTFGPKSYKVAPANLLAG